MKLTAKARNRIPGNEFAGPDRSYPIEDESLEPRIRAAVHRKYPHIAPRKRG